MIINELQLALQRLTEDRFRRFRAAFGGDYLDRASVVDHFVMHPGHERRLSQLLGVATQQEKTTIAAQLAARASRNAAIAACIAALIALASLVWRR